MKYKLKALRTATKNIKLLLLFVVGALVFVDCTGDSDTIGGPEQPLDLAEIRMDMAIHIADNFVVPAFVDVATKSDALMASMLELSTAPTESNLTIVKANLKSTWLSWQKASIYQMGPTEVNALRGAINTYPIDEDKIESNITKGTWVLGAIDNNTAIGFPGLDYLLNSEGSEKSSLDLFQEEPVRIEYFLALGEAINNKINKVSQEWQTGAFVNNYKSDVANGTDVGSSLGLLVNAIDLHFQRFLRDGKVAIPSGIRSAGVPRPSATEAFYGGYSGELLQEALKAYVDLFNGNGINGVSGTSFVTYLNALDQGAIADDLVAALDQSLTLAQGLDLNLTTQIENDNEKMMAAFIAMQEFVTILKSDMSSVMGITITNQDNDGD